MNYVDDIGLAMSILPICIIVFILLFAILIREFDFETDLLKKFITFVPRQIVKIFKIRHKHHYVCTSCGECGLAGNVAFYECIWCGDMDAR